tara:strand:- start:595 stop:807 length:213 start_codon:yes stop_codon:yes gene_type:complete
MDIKTVCNTLQPIFDLSSDVMETNLQYQKVLARLIQRQQEAGKPLEEMALREIRELVRAANTQYLATQES